jgi:hypothetical protein
MDGATVSPRLRHFLPNLCCGFAASKVSAMFWSCKRPVRSPHNLGRILPRQLRAQGDRSRPPRRRSNADIHPTAAVDARTSAAVKGSGRRLPDAHCPDHRASRRLSPFRIPITTSQPMASGFTPWKPDLPRHEPVLQCPKGAVTPTRHRLQFFCSVLLRLGIDYGDNYTLLHDQVIPRLRRFRPFARPSECSSARLRTDGAMERLGDKEAALRLGRGGRPVPLR